MTETFDQLIQARFDAVANPLDGRDWNDVLARVPQLDRSSHVRRVPTRVAFAVAAGISEERICLDPGIGFGKTVAHNLELVRRLDVLLELGRPVLVGFSRKSSLRKLTGSDDLLGASVAAAVAAFERGATILRVHDVKPHVDALTVAAAVA